MGQILHGSAKTTHAIRGELQRSQASVASLARKYGINEKTVLKWRHRQSVDDMPMGPKEGPVSNFVRGAGFVHQTAKRSPKMTANCVLASNHSRGGRFHSSAA